MLCVPLSRNTLEEVIKVQNVTGWPYVREQTLRWSEEFNINVPEMVKDCAVLIRFLDEILNWASVKVFRLCCLHAGNFINGIIRCKENWECNSVIFQREKYCCKYGIYPIKLNQSNLANWYWFMRCAPRWSRKFKLCYFLIR